MKSNNQKVAGQQPPTKQQQPLNAKQKHKKLASLPPTHKISKRPLLHPAIPSPRTSASTPKIVYISASSPFISIIKRVRSLLEHVEDRASGEIKLTRDGRDTFKLIEKGLKGSGTHSNGKDRPRDEEVQVRATGKAIQQALQVAIKLQAEDKWRVRFETGSVGAVDDVVEREGAEKIREREVRRERKGDGDVKIDDKEGSGGNGEDVEMGGNDVVKDVGEDVGDDNTEELEASRIRRVSCFIIYVGLK